MLDWYGHSRMVVGRDGTVDELISTPSTEIDSMQLCYQESLSIASQPIFPNYSLPRLSAKFLSLPPSLYSLLSLSPSPSTDDDGPEICEPVSEFLTCNNSNAADRMCGRQEVCTAACNCWDGTMNRSSNTEQFINSNIEGQGEGQSGAECVCSCL